METTIEKVIHLQRIEMFGDIPSEQLAHLAAIAQDVHVSKGEILFSEGDSSASLYILIDGGISLERENGYQKTIGKDEAFGIWGFFDRKSRLYTAKVTEDSYLLKIDNADFFDLIEDRVHLSRGLIKFLVGKIRELVDQVDQEV
ncbi:MAG: cyclic nucleotide-binding domain-containing protein [Balneolaceae bacterium]|nr:cyclic nucleotide-binding domain-containing protein [Balneolaceae bacterium]